MRMRLRVWTDRKWWRVGGAVLLLGLSGCGADTPPTPPTSSYGSSSYDYGYGDSSQEISFLNDAPSQAAPEVGLFDITLTDLQGAQAKVSDFAKGRSIVLVVTRGNTDPVCPYCSTQTAHYIRDYAKFADKNAEVVLVYPVAEKGDESRWSRFLEDVRGRLTDPTETVPFPVVFDVQLAAVDKLGIRKDLSKPATYIVDPEGTVRYAYVGATWVDRPSTAAVLAELDALGKSDAAGE
ncbi:MAG: redoxin domain-containing protein [Planctomycetaceae bacterium]